MTRDEFKRITKGFIYENTSFEGICADNNMDKAAGKIADLFDREMKVVLRQSDVIKSVCEHPTYKIELDAKPPYRYCTKCGEKL